MPLDTGDEARRALVSLEMIISGDYLTPTLHGERYFNKPPLYNWLIIGSYRLFGNYSTFALRFPMILSLLGLGAAVFAFVRRYINAPVATAAALMMLTNGRVLFYDATLGLIEITFALTTYLTMMLIYHYDQRRNYWLLYTTAYALTATGFLLKGLPPLVFLAFTLLGWFAYTRQLRRLLHPAHVLGLGLFLLITGSYYVAYFSRNAIPLQDVASVLLTESTKRTGLHLGLGATLLHLVTFPFEFIYHFVPYTLLLGLLIRRGLRQQLTTNPFVAFNALTFCLTVLVYWLSPEVYGRYLIGLVPLLFTVLAHLYLDCTPVSDGPRHWIERSWLVVTVVVALGCWVSLLYPTTRVIPGVFWKTALVSALLGGLAWLMCQQPAHRLLLLVGTLVVIRLGFNWLVLPGRAAKRQFYQDSAVAAARLTLGHPLYGYKTTVGATNATDVSTFHITATRGDILRRTDKQLPGAFYIADSISLGGAQVESVGSVMLFDRHPALIVRFDGVKK
ncbi:glycosyltransferase family 39 protein [Fibrella sp. HMF5335]|uniref:Glycosyltransferase family 39 protein n=2 Tax=Fibrella rubiginis TaxID=2817060 RepID=A0A939GLA7_9BACT|nr:glycosyltransferase family 39 protein [Fibrella rubiginis]